MNSCPRHISYHKLYLTVTMTLIPNTDHFYSNYRNAVQKIGKYRISPYRAPPSPEVAQKDLGFKSSKIYYFQRKPGERSYCENTESDYNINSE